MNTDPEPYAESVADGFGNEWRRCAHPKCDLHVVRPGKAQCSNYCWFEFDTAFPGELIDGEEG